MKESIDQYELRLQYSIERRFQTIIIVVRYVDSRYVDSRFDIEITFLQKF